MSKKYTDAAGTFIVPVALTTDSGSYTMYNSTALESGSIVKAGSGVLYKLKGYNSGSAQFVQLHNSTGSLVNGDIPTVIVVAAEQSNFSWDPGSFGMPFSTGIVVTNSSLDDTLDTGSNNCWFNIMYQ